MKPGKNKSLMRKWLGSYKAIDAIASNAYRLEVSEGIRGHTVVHTTLLKSFIRQVKPQDRNEDEEDTWEVDEIVNLRRIKELEQYRV